MGRERGLLVLAVLAAPALSACDSGTGNSNEATSIIVSPPAVNLDAIGAADTLAAEVRDGEGRTLAEATVSWSSSDESVVTVSASGIAIAVANGNASITAASGGASKTVAVTVAQRAETLTQEGGDEQSGAAGRALAQPIVVRVLDRLGNPARGVPVSFQAFEGGGSFTPSQPTTGPDGRAQAVWTLGTDAGETQRARVYASFRVEAAVEFQASASAGPPASATALSGNDQSGPMLTTLLAPIVIRVADAFGNPVPGVSAAFSTSPTHGSFSASSVTTDSLGRASSFWTLGSPLGTQSASVNVGGLPVIPLVAVATEVPAAVEIAAGDGQTGVVGTPLPVAPSVRVLDAQGDPVASLDVRFTAPGGLLQPQPVGTARESVVVRTSGSGIAEVGAWILGTTAGAFALEVVVPGLPALLFDATALAGPPSLVTRVSGDGQRGMANEPVPDPLVARVTDSFGNPVSGVAVTFAPAPSSGSVTPNLDTSDAQGRVSTTWTLGSSAGAQFVTASIPGASVLFSGGVLGLSGLEIELQYLQQPTAAQVAVIEDAAARWSEVIPGRLTPQAVQIGTNQCGLGSPAINRTIDDVLVVVRIAEIDQAFGTLAQAGVCVVRPGGLPAVARLTLDAADVARLEGLGALGDLVLHELAHALGFGTLWNQRGLLVNPSLPNTRGADTYFAGASAVAAFDAIGGSSYTAGQKVPVENREGGIGTRDSHWRLAVLENELMTGFLIASSSPLSRVTVASLEDLGYEVDEQAADAFSIGPFPSPPRVDARIPPVPLVDDVIHGPIYEVGPDGRVRRVLESPPANQ